MKFHVVKNLNGHLVPAYDSDKEKLKKLKVDAIFEVDVKQPRNYEFHKKFFALIELVFQHQEVFKNKDHLRKELTKAAGFYNVYHNHKGVAVYEAQSISFAKMTQEQFDELYKRFLDVVEEIFDFDKEDVQNNLNQFY